LHVGTENEPLLLVDSFIKGAYDLKNYAIEKNNFSKSDSYYPGLRMSLPTAYTIALAKNLSPFIDGLFGLNLESIKKAVSRFSIVTTPPEDLDLLQRIPHIDSPSKDGLAVVHYLKDAPDSGTSLYRHRATGYEYVDGSRYETYMAHVKNYYSDPANNPSGYMYGSNEEYEEIMSFEAKFNRLIMYRGTSLHSGIIRPDYNFDASPQTGRLTITSFYEFA
jgi:hypothetical protein